MPTISSKTIVSQSVETAHLGGHSTRPKIVNMTFHGSTATAQIPASLQEHLLQHSSTKVIIYRAHSRKSSSRRRL